MAQLSIVLMIVIAVAVAVAGFQMLWLLFGPCRNRTDLVFMLDDSGSISNADFDKTMEFVKTLTTSEDISVDEGSVNVALCKFANDAGWMDMAKEKFLSDESQIDNVLDNYQRNIGETNTIEALEFVGSEVLKKGRGSHDKTILIFLTDGAATLNGKPQKTSIIESEAAKLKTKGVKIYAVGVGKETVEEQIETIASAPSDKYVRSVDNFDQLEALAKSIGEEICEPNYWLVSILIAIALAFVVLKLFLDWKEASELDTAGEDAPWVAVK